MDAASALADLREIAPHLRAVILLGAGGEPVAATADDPGAFAAAVGRLVDEAGALRPGGQRAVERLHVLTGDSSVFAVASGDRTLAAVVAADAPPPLVFYDLTTCLARLAPDTADAEP